MAATLVTVAACTPATVAFLSIPIEVPDATPDAEPLEGVEIRVPLDELASKMAGFDLETLSFYHRGRDPIPFQLADEDGDGQPDVAVVVLASLPPLGDRLIAVCDGSRPPDEVPQVRVRDAVRLRFDSSWR